MDSNLNYAIVMLLILLTVECNCKVVEVEQKWFTIQGKVQPPQPWANKSYLPEWKLQTQVLIYGADEYRAFLK